MDYAGWITAIVSLLEYPDISVTDAGTATPTGIPAFDTLIPRAIEYTELRIQRDLDLVATTVTSTGTMIANQRLQTLPQVNIPAVGQVPALVGTPIPPGSLLTTTASSMLVNVEWEGHGLTAGQMVALLTPVPVGGLTLGGDYTIQTVVDADNFTINVGFDATSTDIATVVGNGIYIVCTQVRLTGQPPLEPVTRDFLDYSWPSDASLGSDILPVQWCPNDQSNILVGPAPATALGFEVVGTMRIPQLSPENYQNFLTLQFPDLYVAASMVFFSGFQRDFGAQSEDPKMAQSWESQYQTLKSGATVEEARKQFANMFPSPSNPAGLTAKSQGN